MELDQKMRLLKDEFFKQHQRTIRVYDIVHYRDDGTLGLRGLKDDIEYRINKSRDKITRGGIEVTDELEINILLYQMGTYVDDRRREADINERAIIEVMTNNKRL